MGMKRSLPATEQRGSVLYKIMQLLSEGSDLENVKHDLFRAGQEH